MARLAACSDRHREDSLLPTRASNRLPWKLLARACAESPGADRTADSLRLLEHAVEACGAERAFLARVGPGGQCRVEVARSTREDEDRSASRTALLRAAARRRTFVCADTARDGLLAAAVSVRRLALRWIAAAPLSGGNERWLVVDGRPTARARRRRPGHPAGRFRRTRFAGARPPPVLSESDPVEDCCRAVRKPGSGSARRSRRWRTAIYRC